MIDVYRIDPDKLKDVLGKTPESPRARWAGPPPIEIEGLNLTVFYADPLCLMCLPDDNAARAVNGNLIYPNRLYVRWHDPELDQVRVDLEPIWGVVEALSPDVYDALMTARHHDLLAKTLAEKADGLATGTSAP